MSSKKKHYLHFKTLSNEADKLKFTIDTTLGTGASFTIPTSNLFTYNYNVNWGDGNTTNNHTSNASHTYTNGGVYNLEITGIFPKFNFNNTGDKLKLTSITQWGNVEWNLNQTYAFSGCSNLISLPNDGVFTSNIVYASSMFSYTTFNSNMSNWDVSNILDMTGFFWYGNGRNQDLGLWNFNKNVILASFLFANNMNATYIDSLLIKLASRVVGTGRTQTNKTLGIYQGKRTSASTSALNALLADGWTLQYAITLI